MPWLGVRHNVAFGLAALRRPKRISSADRGSADPPLEAFIRPWLWRVEDWVNFTMLYGPGMMRLALLFEVGFGRGGKDKET